MIRFSICFLVFFTLWSPTILWSQNSIIFQCYNLDSISWTLELPECPSPQIDSFQILSRSDPDSEFIYRHSGFDGSVHGYRDEILKSHDAVIVRYFISCPSSLLLSDTLKISDFRESVQILSTRVLANGDVEITWEEKPIQGIRYVVNAAVGGSSQVLATDLRKGRYTDTRGLAHRSIEYYSISAVLDCGYTIPEPDSFFHTSYLSMDPDPCSGMIHFNFQPYSYWNSGTASSTLMVSRNNVLTDSVDLPAGTSEFAYGDLTYNENFTFYVRERGASSQNQVAYSNPVEVFTDFYPPIRWITINDFSFDENNSLSMSWRTNEHHPVHSFEVNDAHSTSPIIQNDLMVLLADQEYQWMAGREIDPNLSYQISLQDSCGNMVTSVAKRPLITQGQLTSGNEMHVRWTDVGDAEWQVSAYEIHGSTNGTFTLLGTAAGHISSFSHSFDPGATLDSLCYFVVARGDIHYPDESGPMEIRSNTVCLYGETIVEIPNAHSAHQPPYKPVIVPKSNLTSYVMRIFDRYGSLVFETNDPEQGWNGRYQSRNGFADVFVVQVEITNSQGESIEKTGSMLFFP